MNLNYPDYSQGFGGYSRTPTNYQPQATMPSGGGVQDLLSIASPIASIAGIGLGAYGQYQQQQAIEAQNELAQQMFEEERQRAKEKDRMEREAMMLSRDFGFGNYAQNEQDNVMNQFGGYARQVGL